MTQAFLYEKGTDVLYDLLLQYFFPCIQTVFVPF